MKKLLVTAAAAVLTLSIAACSDNSKESNTEINNATATAMTSAPEAGMEATTTVEVQVPAATVEVPATVEVTPAPATAAPATAPATATTDENIDDTTEQQ